MKLLSKLFLAALLFVACETEQKLESAVENPTTSQTNTPETAPVVKKDDYLYGIDISSYQGDEAEGLDKNKDSLSFVICRATDGVTYQDPDFSTNWSTLEKKGFTRGAYHFFESDDDASSQVNNYVNTVGDLTNTDLPPIIDFEGAGIHDGATVDEIVQTLKEVIEAMESSYSRKPIIYTNPSIGNTYLTDSYFSKYPLWIADYSGEAEPIMPGAWAGSDWVLWQQTDSYVLNGDKSDFDLFNGGQAAFQAFLKGN